MFDDKKGLYPEACALIGRLFLKHKTWPKVKNSLKRSVPHYKNNTERFGQYKYDLYSYAYALVLESDAKA